MVSVTAVVLALTCGLVYQVASKTWLEDLRARLRVDAALIAAEVDGDLHDRIHTADDPGYEQVRAHLRQARALMPEVRDIYTMRQVDGTLWQFVVDAEAPDSPIYSPPETAYDMSQDPESQRAVSGPVASSEVYLDEYGAWVSGYAPIYAADGRVVGIVGVDMSGERLVLARQRIKAWMWASFWLGVAVSLVTSLWWSGRFADPIEVDRVKERAARQVAEMERDRAVQIARVKTEFLSTMSHEIRTPMVGVIGVAELALAQAANPEQRSHLRTVLDSARVLMRILNDVLDLSKIEARGVEIEVAACSPRAVLDQTLALLGPSFDNRGLELVVAVDPDLPSQVVTDGGRVGQVLLNLLNNALKFTEEGQVIVRLFSFADHGKTELMFQVEDSGPGIAPEFADHIFQPFSYADAGERRRVGGSGLGLSIAQRIVEKLGGTIGFEAAAVRGTLFWFRIPVDDASFLIPEAELETRQTHAQPDQAPASIRDARILLADDNATNRLVVQAQLQALGLTCDVVADGRAALDRCAVVAYDLVLMDCEMPELDGFGAVRELRRREVGRGQRAAVVALTAHAGASIRRECLDAGMDDLLSKPFTLSQLYGVVLRWLATAPS